MKYWLFVICLAAVLFLPSLGQSQEKVLTRFGTVTDSASRLPIEGAQVTVVGKKHGQMNTDAAGRGSYARFQMRALPLI